MRTKAAVLYGVNQPVRIEDVDLEPPRRGEVLVRVVNVGVCHSELHLIHGTMPTELPVVLGHEGAGIVEEVGDGVTTVKRGDHVILLWRTVCNHCYYCAVGQPALCDSALQANTAGTMPDGSIRFSRGDQHLHHFVCTSCLSEYTVMDEYSLVLIPNDVPLPVAAVIGCAVMTGLGAVVNSARVQPGTSVAVFGTGGVGLSAVIGASLAGASRIIAVDLNQQKLEWARSVGATDAVNAASTDPVAAIRDLTDGRGAEYSFEAIGLPRVMEQAFAATRRGGMTVVIGSPPTDSQIHIPARVLQSQERILRGSLYGSSRPHYDIPRVVNLYRSGRIPLDKLITRHYSLDEYNEALRALEAGEVARSVIDVTPA